MMKQITVVLGLFILIPSFAFLAGEKPSASAKQFMEWYAKNQERLNKIDLVLNYTKATSTGNGKNYDVDFKSVEKYLTELKKSNLIGPKFVENLRAHFKKCESEFKSNPQSSGVPRGFENDFVVKENNFDFTGIEKAEVKDESIKSNSYAIVKLKFANGKVLTYEFAKQSNIWLINTILN